MNVKLSIKLTDLDLIEETVSNLHLMLFPNSSMKSVSEFSDAPPPTADSLYTFFRALPKIPVENVDWMRSNMPTELKACLKDQISTCFLFVNRCRQEGWTSVYIPEDFSAFLSIAPKELLFSLNKARYEKGIHPTGEDYIELMGFEASAE